MLGATTSRVEQRVEELREWGIDAASRIGDLTIEDAARDLVSTTVDLYGRLGILVNNAGMV
jgi:3-oxoacyl-[acyl-carrier protein] reductase